MIVVYHGKSKQTYIKVSHSRKYVFKWGVPTFIKDSLADMLDMDEFSEYKPEKRNTYTPERIYIELPSKTLEFFLASLRSVKKIQEYFPTCEIECYTNPDWKILLPKKVKYLQSFSPSAISKYYRQYNFNEK